MVFTDFTLTEWPCCLLRYIVGAANLIYFKSLLMFSLSLSHHCTSMNFLFFFQKSQIFLNWWFQKLPVIITLLKWGVGLEIIILWWVPVKLSRQTYFCLDVFGWTNIITSYLYRIKFPIIRSVNDSENKVSSPPRIWSDKAYFWPDIVHWLAVQAIQWPFNVDLNKHSGRSRRDPHPHF